MCSLTSSSSRNGIMISPFLMSKCAIYALKIYSTCCYFLMSQINISPRAVKHIRNYPPFLHTDRKSCLDIKGSSLLIKCILYGTEINIELSTKIEKQIFLHLWTKKKGFFTLLHSSTSFISSQVIDMAKLRRLFQLSCLKIVFCV